MRQPFVTRRAIGRRVHARNVWARVILCATALLVGGSSPTHARSANRTDAAEPAVLEVADGRLTLDVDQAPLAEILDAIARDAHLVVEGRVASDATVTARLHDAPLDEGLRVILHDHSYALQYSLGRDALGRPMRVPSRLRIFRGEAATREPGQPSDPDRTASDEPAADVALLSNVLLTAEDIADKWDAIDALGEAVNSEEALPVLRFALTDPDEDVRLAVVDALASQASDGAAEALEVALRDPDGSVREEAIVALEAIGGDRAAHSLLVALQHEDPDLRVQAVDALGSIGGPTARQLLEYAWASDADESVRTTAAAWLEEQNTNTTP